MSRSRELSRREMLLASAGTVGALALAPAGVACAAAVNRSTPAAGRLKQSVSRWPYGKIPLPEFARACKATGLAGIDLLQPGEWAVVRDAGLVPTMGYPADRPDFIATGFNDRANHAMLLRELEATIPRAA